MPAYNNPDKEIKFGFYNYNFFHLTSGTKKVELTYIWRSGQVIKNYSEVRLSFMYIFY